MSELMQKMLRSEPDITVAGATFPAIEMAPIVIAMHKAGYSANGAISSKLWLRFSNDQCATWINFEGPNKEEIERFIKWLNSGLNNDEAFS